MAWWNNKEKVIIKKELNKSSIKSGEVLSQDLNDFSFINYGDTDFSFIDNNIECASKIEVIDSILKYIARWFVQGEIQVFDSSGKKIEDDELVAKIKNPNSFQTYEDFLAQWVYFIKADGSSIIVPFSSSIGYEKDIKRLQLFNLNPDNTIHFNNKESIFTTDRNKDCFKYSEEVQKAEFSKQKITRTFKYEDVLSFVDVVSGITDNKYTGNSNLDSLHDEIKNIYLSKIAKRNKLNLSGITLVTPEAKEGQMSMGLDKTVTKQGTKTHKDLITQQLTSAGLTSDTPIIVSATNLRAQNLTQGITDLDFDKECLPDYRRIYNKFGLSDEISNVSMSNGGLGDNGGRRDAAILSFIQNIIEPLGNNFIRTFEQFFDTENTYKMSYSHLPIYQTAKKKQCESDSLFLANIINAKREGLITEEHAKELVSNINSL